MFLGVWFFFVALHFLWLSLVGVQKLATIEAKVEFALVTTKICMVLAVARP